jgi:hypothetical protein
MVASTYDIEVEYGIKTAFDGHEFITVVGTDAGTAARRARDLRLAWEMASVPTGSLDSIEVVSRTVFRPKPTYTEWVRHDRHA